MPNAAACICAGTTLFARFSTAWCTIFDFINTIYGEFWLKRSIYNHRYSNSCKGNGKKNVWLKLRTVQWIRVFETFCWKKLLFLLNHFVNNSTLFGFLNKLMLFFFSPDTIEMPVIHFTNCCVNAFATLSFNINKFASISFF